MLSMAVGLMVSDATLIDHAQKYFTAFIKAGIFDTGEMAEWVSWNCTPECPGGMWGHVGATIGALVSIADMHARATGDTSYYTLTAPSGVIGQSGTTVGLQNTLTLWAGLANDTVIQYGTTSGAELDFQHRLTWDSEANGAAGDYGHFVMMVANLFYNHAGIHTAMGQTIIDGLGSGQCRDPGLGGCVSGYWGPYANLPFMFGNMEGVVNPFAITAGSPVVVLSASPDTILPSGSSTLSWSSTDATSCTASGGWSGSKALTGSESVSPTVTTTYTLTCTGAIAPDGADSAVVTVAAPAPVACYPFDGTGVDSTGLGHLATLQNGATYAAGIFNQALLLDGVNDYVSIAHAADLTLTGDMSVDFWANLSAAADTQVVMSKEDAGTSETPFHVELAVPGLRHYQWYRARPGGRFQYRAPV